MRWRRRTAPALAAVILTAAVAFGTTVGAAGVSVDDEPPPLLLQVVTYGPDVLVADRALATRVSVENASLAPVANLEIVLDVTTSPFVNRPDLARWDAGELDVPMREVTRSTVGSDGGVPAAGTSLAFLVVEPEDLGFTPGTSAVAGVEIRLEHRGETLTTMRSFATWLDSAAPVTPVSVIVVASGSVERVDALLGAASLPGVTFAVDPTVLSREAAGRLSLPDTYLLPAPAIDLPSLARGGSADLLDRALSDARASGTLPDSAPWMAVATDIDRATENLAASRGASAVVSLPSLATQPAELSGYSGGVPPGYAVSSDGIEGRPILIYPDLYLSAALSAVRPDSDMAEARIVAETALLAAENTASNPVVVVVGPSWSVDASGRSDALGALLGSPWVEPVSLTSALLTAEPATAVLQPAVASASDIPPDLAASAGNALRGITALANAVDEPEDFSAALVAELLHAIEMDRRADSEARDDQLVTALAAITEVLKSVRVPEGSTLNLISNTGNVPVTVTNDLDVEVTVVVVVESRTAKLRVDDRPVVVVAPGTSQQVLVPVTAISNGNAAVRLSLTNTDGERLTPVTEVKIRIHAQWGTLFTAALGAMVALLLLAGTIRTARRGRADTRQRPSPDPLAGEE